MEQAKAIKDKVKNGGAISIDDLFILNYKDINKANRSLSILRNGGDYSDLKLAGFTDAEAIRDLSIYKLKVDVDKYDIETAFSEINTNTNSFVSFCNFLRQNDIPTPALNTIEKEIRANGDLSKKLLEWYKNGLNKPISNV